jgi:hypothetical protein
MGQHHPLDEECISLYFRALKKGLTSFRAYYPFCCWHLWAKACPKNLSEQLRSRSCMNSLPLRVRDQALTSGFLMISSHNIQLRCICRSWVFISTCKYKQYGTYLENVFTAPYKPINKITFGISSNDKIQKAVPWNCRQACYQLRYTTSYMCSLF